MTGKYEKSPIVPPLFFDAINDESSPFDDRMRHAMEMTMPGECDEEVRTAIVQDPRWEAWLKKNSRRIRGFGQRVARKAAREVNEGPPLNEHTRNALRALRRHTKLRERFLAEVIDATTPGFWVLIYQTDSSTLKGASVISNITDRTQLAVCLREFADSVDRTRTNDDE